MEAQRGHRLRRTAYWVLDHPWYLLLALGVVLFTNWVIGTRSQPHHVRAEFTNAFNLVSGLPIEVDGLQVGMVSGVQFDNTTPGGGAIVTIGINDGRYWPLHQGAGLQTRFGSTIGNVTRAHLFTPLPCWLC